MRRLERLQEQLRAMNCDAMLIPSTDEYLSEFTQPFARRLEWITGFRGSMGTAVVMQDRAALFLDGRYRAQGERESAAHGIEIQRAGERALHEWLATHLRRGQRLATDGRLQSYPEIERLRTFAATRGIETMDLAENPIDELWGTERPAEPVARVIDYPIAFAGLSAAEKCTQLAEWLTARGDDLHLIADPEDVAWLINVRIDEGRNDPISTSSHVVPVPLSRVLVEAIGEVYWFIEPSRLEPNLRDRLAGSVEILEPCRFEAFLADRLSGKVISANVRRTPHRFAALAARLGTLRDDPVVSHRRWQKHPTEIQRAREGHRRDGLAVIRFMAWLQRTIREQAVTEIEASQQLTELRKELPEYRGNSMPMMSASGPNSALPHYVPSDDTNSVLNDHPIYWMDSGGQYYGCSTDNTLCMALGEPESRHIQAHTLVVKGFIALARARFPVGLPSTQLDSFARQYLWQHGMDYDHGTGHGVGNFMNIHEGPAIRKNSDFPTVAPMVEGMIVSNEPAFYREGEFGIRIESHLATVRSAHEGFLEFETLSRLPIDPRLIDASLLTVEEKRWLADYHQRIQAGYECCFDDETTQWLRGIVEVYLDMVR